MINPLVYDKPLSPKDLERLRTIFGLKYQVLIENELEFVKPANSGIILELAKNSNMGHWVAYKIIDAKRCYYFNSLGVVPNETIVRFLKGYELFYTSFDIQHTTSYFCGHYCLDFLIHCQTSQIQDYYKQYSNDEIENDKILHNRLFNPEPIGNGRAENALIGRIYYSEKGYKGVEKIYNKVKSKGVSYTDVKKYIDKQQINNIMKQPRKNLDYLHYTSDKINHYHQSDILYVDTSNGRKYILGIIDIHTRYLRMEPLNTDRSSKSVIAAAEKIYKSDKYLKYPKIFQTDAGSEFTSREFKKYLKDRRVEPEILIHAYLIERAFFTIQRPLYAYRDTHYTKNWVRLLPKVVEGYNDDIHSTLKMTPREAAVRSLDGLYIPKYHRDYKPVKKPKFKVGQRVLVRKDVNERVKYRGVDFKYNPSVVYEISEVNTNPVVYYKLRDTFGVFYNSDLLKEDLENKIDEKRWARVFE